jgi:hypothetical protein
LNTNRLETSSSDIICTAVPSRTAPEAAADSLFARSLSIKSDIAVGRGLGGHEVDATDMPGQITRKDSVRGSHLQTEVVDAGEAELVKGV